MSGNGRGQIITPEKKLRVVAKLSGCWLLELQAAKDAYLTYRVQPGFWPYCYSYCTNRACKFEYSGSFRWLATNSTGKTGWPSKNYPPQYTCGNSMSRLLLQLCPTYRPIFLRYVEPSLGSLCVILLIKCTLERSDCCKFVVCQDSRIQDHRKFASSKKCRRSSKLVHYRTASFFGSSGCHKCFCFSLNSTIVFLLKSVLTDLCQKTVNDSKSKTKGLIRFAINHF